MCVKKKRDKYQAGDDYDEILVIMEKNNSNREAVLCCVGDEAESRIGSCVRWSKSEKSRTLCWSLGGRRESLEKIVPVDSKEM